MFGIQKLKRDLRKIKDSIGENNYHNNVCGSLYGLDDFSQPTVWEKIEELDGEIKTLKSWFEELDEKFDLLERFLEVELVEIKEEKQVYDWVESSYEKKFQKTDSYEEIKESKENA